MGMVKKSENQFVRMDKDGKAYYAVFNYMDQELKMTTALERLGLDSSKEYKLKKNYGVALKVLLKLTWT